MAGLNLRSGFWGVVLAAGLLAWPVGAVAQTIAINPASGSTQTVDEGMLDMDGALTAATVTLQQVTYTFQAATGVGGETLTSQWGQVSRETFDGSPGSLVSPASSECLGSDRLLSSDDPGFVTLSNNDPLSVTVAYGTPVSLATPSFTAPDVSQPTTLYFVASVHIQSRYSQCHYLAVTINDVEPPVITGLTDLAYNEGDVLADGAIAATVDDDGPTVSFLALTSTTGPSPPPPFWSVTTHRNQATTTTPGFTVPEWTQDYTLTYTLTVSDRQGLTATDTFTISVTADDDPPVANAGPDQTVSEDDALVTLAGSGSDPEGTRITSYRWTQTSGPSVDFLTVGSIPSPGFRPPQLTANAALVFSLVVTDANEAASAPDTVTITITADNDAPQVQVDDQFVEYGRQVVLQASVSDPEGLPLRLAWEQTSGPAVTLSSTTARNPIFTAPQSGGAVSVTLGFRLTVTDSGGLSASDTADVEVRASTAGLTLEPTVSLSQVSDLVGRRMSFGPIRDRLGALISRPPTAGAGPDQEVNEGDTVTLTGSGSDPDGDTLQYTWILFSPPRGTALGSQVVFSDANAASTTFTAPNVAALTDLFVLLVVEDYNSGGTRHGTGAADVVRIQVSGTNDAPTVDAGADQTVEEGDTVILSATIGDAEGGVFIEWTQDSGPAVTFSSASAVQPWFIAPNQLEDYDLEFTVQVTDLHGATATDSVTISVTADNDAPVADAGAPYADAVAGSTVRLDGSPRSGPPLGLVAIMVGSADPEGETLSYAWEQVLASVPPGGGDTVYTAIAMDHADRVALTGAATATPSFTAPDRTVDLFFRLTVTDPGSLAGTAVASVRVVKLANAGEDIAAFEGVLVTLDGSGSVELQDYAWEQISGAPMVSLSSSTAQSPTFVAPDLSAAEAVLGFRLSTTDSAGRRDSDEVQVTLKRFFTVAATAPATLGEGAAGSVNALITVAENVGQETRSYSFEWEQTAGPPVLLPQSGRSYAFLAPTPIEADVTLEFRVTATLLTHPNQLLDMPGGNVLAPLTDVTAVSAPVQVTVTRDASATRPTIGANIAGPDLTLPAGSDVTLQGVLGSSPMGTTLVHRWIQTGGTSVSLRQGPGSNAGATGSARFRAPQRPEVLTFQFSVIEIAGAADMRTAIGAGDTMTVTLTNRPPVANAGMDLTVAGGEAVSLDGSASNDPDEGDAVTYAWTQIPPTSQADSQIVVPVTLANADAAVATFTAPSLPAGAPLHFRLRVTSEGGMSEDTLRVFVQADPGYVAEGISNRPPVAHAGADQQVLPGASVTLDGRLSGDPDLLGAPDQAILGYQWTQVSGPAAVLPGRGALGSPAGGVACTPPDPNPNMLTCSADTIAVGATPTFTAPANAGRAPVQLVFRLVVSDGLLLSAPDEVVVTVLGNADAALSSLTVNLQGSTGASYARLGALPLSPAFDPDTAAYSLAMPNAFGRLRITAVPRARGALASGGSLTGATVAVAGTQADGTALTSAAHMTSTEQFELSGLADGANTVTITVTAPDGSTGSTTLTVNRAAAVTGSSALAGLYLRNDPAGRSSSLGSRSHADAIALSPAFATATTAYTAQVPNRVTSMRVEWLRSTESSAADATTAMIAAGSSTAASCSIESAMGFLGTGRTFGRIADCPLEVGANTLTLVVTEPGGGTDAATTYTVTVTRNAPGTDATLSALSVSGGVGISPAFDPATTSYTTQVGSAFLDVIPVTTDEQARFAVSGAGGGGTALRVFGAQVSGAAARVTGLQGESTITIRVYAEDSTEFATDADGTQTPIRVPVAQSPTTTRDYTLRVTRVAAPQIASDSGTVLELFLAAISPLSFTNSGGPVPTGGWTVNPALPAGLSLNADTGVISGTPESAQAATSYTVTARNARGASSVELVITISTSLRSLSVARVAETVAEDGTPGAAEFNLTLSGVAPTADIEVAWTLQGASGAVLPGAANADFGAPEGGAGISVNANNTSGSARWATGATLPATLTVRVPVLQDVLNEGAETLTLSIMRSTLTAGGTTASTSEVALAGGDTASVEVTVSASDPIAVTLARAAGESGRLVSGDAVNYVATLGATASTNLMLAITATLGGSTLTVPDVTVTALATEAAVMLPASLIDAATAAAAGEVQLAVAVSGVTGAPSGATAAPAATGASVSIGVVGWELSLSGAERVGEGGALVVTATLRGTATPGALMAPWQVQVSGMQPVPADFVRGADYQCGAAAVGDVCTSLPGGTLDFSGASDAAARSLTFSVQTARDDDDESGAPESFTVRFGTLTGAQAAAVGISDTAGTLESAISDALRTLSVSGPMAAVDEDSVTAAGQTAFADFTITLNGAELPVSDVVVTWTLSSPDDSITLPAAAGLGRNVEARDVGGSRTGTVTFAAAGLSFPATQMVRVPILQDALNEGVENLQLVISADMNAGGRMPGTPPSVPATLVSQAMATAMVAPSDDINLQVEVVPDEDGVLTPGEGVSFRISFGTTTVNGEQVPIVPSTALTVDLQVFVGTQQRDIQVMVPALEPSVTQEVPAATLTELRTMAGGGTPVLSVGVGNIGGVPSGGMSQVDQASLGAVRILELQVAQWGLQVAPQAAGDSGFAEAAEGGRYVVTFSLSGDAAALANGGLTVGWSVSARAAADGGRQASPGDFGGSSAYSCGGATTAEVACTSFPSGTVTFNQGDASRTLEIFIFDDGDDTEGTTPEGFAVRLETLGGSDAGNTALASGSSLPATLQVDIPALRADLSLADVTAGEGENAVFVLTLGSFVGGSRTTRDVVVAYTLGAMGDTAERGVDYLSAATGQATIAAGEMTGRISIPLVRDGLLELPETFTLTLTDIVERGGGTIRFVDANAAGDLPATGTITDTADQEQRRGERVGTLVSVLDRSSALLAADAISSRIERGGIGAEGEQTASLSLAGRELLGASGASSGGGADLGLALYGAAGLGGASAGLPGGGSGGAGSAGSGTGAAAAFGGLGAGLAGGANMGVRSELPSMARLVGNSGFNLNMAGWNWSDYSNMTLWGSGGVTALRGSPVIGGAKLDYEGDSTAFFIGGENYLREDVLAGVALGFAVGDLDFTDHAAAGYTLTGSVDSETISIHPYASWWLAPDVNVWLSLGYGSGTVNLEESVGDSRGTSTGAAETDLETITVVAGASGRVQVLDDATSLSLNLQITRVRSELDAARFDNGAQLAALNLRSTRIGGEAELGRDFALPGGMTLRPFATAQLRLDLGDAVSQDVRSDRDAAFDLGGGADFTWPDQGVTLRLSGLAQLNDTGHEEHRFSVDVNYDLGADGQGLTMGLQSAFSERRSRGAPGSEAGGAASAFGSAGLGSASLGGTGLGRSGGAAGGSQRLSGEIGYGVAFRQFGRSGLFTPYGRFDVGHSDARWAAGLRLSEPRSALQIGLEAALEGSGAANAGRNYDLLLTGRLRF